MKYLYQPAGILILFTLIMGIASCKKDEPATFPIALRADTVVAVSNIRMFTKDGEIKDPNKMTSFTSGKTYFNVEKHQSGKGMISFTFQSKEKGFFGADPSHIFDVRQNGDQFLFTSEDNAYVSPTDQHSSVLFIFKHRLPVITDPAGNGTTKVVCPAYGTFNNMRFPMLAYYYATAGSGNSFSRFTNMVNNEFDETAIDRLKPNDTLVVRLYHVICTPRP